MKALARSLAEELRARFATLPAGQRRLALAGAAAAALLLFHFALVLPMQRELPRLRASLVEGRAKLGRMHAQAAEATALRALPPAALSRPDAQKAVEQSLDAHGLRAAAKRVAPEAGNAVQVTLEGAAFDALLACLAELDRQQMRAESVVLEARPAGKVDARLLFRGPRP